MTSGDTIQAKAGLTCTIRPSGADLRIVHGVTEELSRDSLVVVVPSAALNRWLKAETNVFIAVDLPFSGVCSPRVLECAATLSCVRSFMQGVRVKADVHRMTVISRDRATRTKRKSAARLCGAEPVSIGNHTIISNSKSGEKTMSFLKNMLAEEDGQDMVEYGLVIALVVLAAAGGYTAFQVQINAALTTLGTSIKAAL
jgi:pilus assembly protein Flp/PilA